jgi:CheY-like chemotaxis protein
MCTSSPRRRVFGSRWHPPVPIVPLVDPRAVALGAAPKLEMLRAHEPLAFGRPSCGEMPQQELPSQIRGSHPDAGLEHGVQLGELGPKSRFSHDAKLRPNPCGGKDSGPPDIAPRANIPGTAGGAWWVMRSSFSTPGQPENEGRIVVVDDDPYVRRALLRLLQSGGYGVRTFASCEEFLASCSLPDVDCLILDVYLVGMSGIELYERLSARGTPPPAIFITARDAGLMSVGLMPRRSPVSCLCKPFDGDELLVEVAHALQRPRSGSALPRSVAR